MYAAALVAAAQHRLEVAFREAFPKGLVRYPVDVCAAMAQRLAPAVDPEGNPTRRLTPEEDSFIANERLLTKIDYRYCAERYHKIRTENGLQPLFPLWEPQEIILQRLAEIQLSRQATGHPDGVLANILKARQEGCCLAPTTRVLTADLRWVSLRELAVGTRVIATDEHSPGFRQSRKMRTAVVEAKREVRRPAFRLVMDNGEVLIATAEHRFLFRKTGGVDTLWKTAGQAVVGDRIRVITQPWGSPDHFDAWYGGLLDGEGSCGVKAGAGVSVNVTQVFGAVYDEAERYLKQRGYSFRYEVDERKPTATSKFGQQPVGRLVLGRMGELFKLLGLCRPVRFIGLLWWEGKELPGKKIGGCWSRIVSITPLGVRTMIDLQTSAQTFIAEGFVSHNSTIAQSLCVHRVTTHTHVNALTASDVPENSGSEGIFGKFELMVEHLPWYLKPATKFHKKDTHWVFDNGSWMTVESGKSMKGGLTEEGGSKGNLGRSKSFSVCHLTELSTWERPEQIDDGLMPAVPRSHRVLVIKESTAKGRHNWHHTDWLLGQRGRGRFTNIFLPWYALAKYWLPAPVGWIPADSTLAHAQKAEQEGPQWLGHPVRLSRNQLYWYEDTRITYTEKGKLANFLEEYAADPEECFQHSGKSIFSIDDLQYLDKLAKPPIDVWTVNPAKDLSAIRSSELEQIRLHKQLAATVAESPQAPIEAMPSAHREEEEGTRVG